MATPALRPTLSLDGGIAVKLPARSRLVLGLLAATLCLFHGDSAQSQAVTSLIGIDPLAILDLQVKPNILIVVDTSGSMRFPPNVAIGGPSADLNLGADDPVAKMYQAKTAVTQVLTQNAGAANFGFATYGLLNSNKRLMEPSYNDGYNNNSGPLTYVSIDANADSWTGGGSGANGQGSVADFFGNNGNAYLGTTSVNVYNSFRTFSQVYPGPGCAANTNCRYYLFSRILRNNVVIRFNTAGGSGGMQAGYPAAYTCPLPPVGLFPQDPVSTTNPAVTSIPRPCFRLETTAAKNPGAVFYYSSGIWEGASGSDFCSSSARLVNVAGCSTDSTPTIKGFLKPEMPVDGSCGDAVGIPCKLGTGGWVNNTTASFDGTNPATVQAGNPNSLYGIMASQSTPLAGVLNDVRNGFPSFFPNYQAGQSNYVLLITDGEDTCADNPATDPPAAARANYTSNPRISTWVIGFGLNSTVLNNIAQAGSGGTATAGVWSGGQNAYTAQNITDLVNQMNAIISQSSTSGEFSDTQTVTESVFELAATAGVDPRDPSVRYNKTVPLLMQSTFEMAGFVGHLNAFRNNGGTSLQVWDAGDKLCQRITGFGATTTPPAKCNVPAGAAGSAPNVATMGNGRFNFAELVGANGGAPNYLQTTGRLRRLIFTTTRNGVFPYAYASSNVANATVQQPSDAGPVVPVWPPSSGVDPSGAKFPAGVLDTALGLSSLTFTQLQTTFGACVKSALDTSVTLPAGCSGSFQLGAAAQEAREMILAYTAGAQVVRDSAGKPRRDTRVATLGQVLYTARSWFLPDGTLSGPAMSPPPLESKPGFAVAEYELYRDGVKAANGSPMSAPGSQVALGYGLRNPDVDSNASSMTASKNDVNLKPVMSVVYYGANDMLHAFRAGPQCATIGTTTCPANTDTGGEELWGFVPFDQLGKLQQLMLQGQDRANHKYVIATALRLSDVFVPGSYKDPAGTTRIGHWRRLLFFGRGHGGKHLTALDVTNPAPFTWCAMPGASNFTPAAVQSTCPNPTGMGTYPPLVLWNRGNPDTQDGTATGTANSATNTNRVKLVSSVPTTNKLTDEGVTDATAYATMGETWSVPAIGRVNSAANNYHDVLMFVGSGYRTGAAGEGRNFYSLDPLTGDILTSVDVGSNSSSVIADNAIVAGPAVFNAAQLSFTTGTTIGTNNPMYAVGDRVYVGDLHGRLWKFATDTPGTPVRIHDFGVGQPIANAVALANYDGGTGIKPHLFVESGNDRRLIVPTTGATGFSLSGLEDNGKAGDTGVDLATLLFSYPLFDRFRGTVQPATAFNAAGNLRVFMVGTRYNPLTVTGTCQSSFDSILYAVAGQTGEAVYDLSGNGAVEPGDVSTTMTGKRVNAVSVSGGTVMVDQGLNAQNAPPPPAPPASQTSSASHQVIVLGVYPGGSPVCR